MKYFLISDNTDTLAGLRLVGVRGVVVHEPRQVGAELEKAAADPAIGIVLLTDQLSKLCQETVLKFQLTRSRPLLVTMPDRHSGDNAAEDIKRYISEAVGIRI